MKRSEQNIIKQRYAESVLSVNSRNFWHEVRKLNGGSTQRCPSYVSGVTDTNDIGELFSSKCQELYYSVSYDLREMSCIREELSQNVMNQSYSEDVAISIEEIKSAIVHLLKPNKADGYYDLSSNHLIHTNDDTCAPLLLSSIAMITINYVS